MLPSPLSPVLGGEPPSPARLCCRAGVHHPGHPTPLHDAQKLHLGLLCDARNNVLWSESQAWDAWESAKRLLLPLSVGAGGAGSFGPPGGCGVHGGPAARGNKQPPEPRSQPGRLAFGTDSATDTWAQDALRCKREVIVPLYLALGAF